MCTDDQHNEKIELLKKLVGNPPEDGTYQISSTRPYSLDYKERKYIYLWTTNDLVLSLEELGTLPVTAGTWINLSLSPGMRIFAQNQATLVPIFIRCSDDPIDPGSATQPPSTPFHLVSANSNNATTVKASPGNIMGYTLSNTNASARWVKFYDKASAIPAPATDTPKHSVQVPANATVIHVFPNGLEFLLGIGFATVVNIADTDNTSVGLNDLSIDLDYE